MSDAKWDAYIVVINPDGTETKTPLGSFPYEPRQIHLVGAMWKRPPACALLTPHKDPN